MSKVIKLAEVILRTGLSRSVIYEKMEEGTFPRSLKLNRRSVGWLEAEVETWIDGLVRVRDGEEGES